MIKTCKTCAARFTVREEDRAFYKRVSPRIDEQIIEIPAPQLCPDCRRQRRLAFRNQRTLYRRADRNSGASFISVYSPDKDCRVMRQDEWWSDSWDAVDFGRDYDFRRSFSEQFAALRRAVPAKALTAINCENCDFTNDLTNSRNCYLVFGGFESQDCYYCTDSAWLTDCVETWWSKRCELCIGVFCSVNLYDCLFCQDCSDSRNLVFCRNCSSCQDCFGCSDLYQKQYCVLNQQYDAAEYRNLMTRFNRGSFAQIEKLKAQVNEFFSTLPQRAVQEQQTEGCSGNLLIRSKNCLDCFTVADSENCSYCFQSARNRDCLDLDYGYDCTALVYEASGAKANYLCAFLSGGCQHCSECYYVDECYHSKNCFGCAGLRQREYCILNKQYSKEEYEKLLPEIVAQMRASGEWGEFLPLSASPFGYNETEAQQYYPLTRDAVLRKGGKWSDFENPAPRVTTIIKSADLPDHISAVSDDILKAAIECGATGKLFRLTRAELEFYRRHNLPLPRKHPEERYRELESLRNPLHLWQRHCSKCSEPISTTWSPERSEQVYCSRCYADFKF